MGLLDYFRKKKKPFNVNPALTEQVLSENQSIESNKQQLLAYVERLLSLYRGKSTGFYESEAEEVRQVGKELNKAGGMEFMIQAYNAFAMQRPECARNLESSWNGIGEWMG